MEKMIGIYGGSFNPFHEGHVFAIRSFTKALSPHKVWVIPCHNPMKNQERVSWSSVSNFILNMNISHYASIPPHVYREGVDRLKYAIDIARFILNRPSSHTFTWIMGTDCIQTLHLWKKWQILINQISIFFISRYNGISHVMSSRAYSYIKSRNLSIQDYSNMRDGICTSFYIAPIQNNSSSKIRKANEK